MSAPTHGSKAVVAALFANLGIAIAKFVGFFITGASSMLAEAVHSVADSGNQALLLYGGKSARRAADDEHPFGYGRARYFWAFVVALVLFMLGAVFAIYEGIHKLQNPHGLDSPGVAVGILVTAIALETYSLRTAVHEANLVRGEQGWVEFIRHSRIPELPVVLLEDIGAEVGLVLALAGVGLSTLTGDPMWDGIGTLCIGVLLGVIAVILVIEMKSLLIGEGATRTQHDAIKAALEQGPDAGRVVHLKTLHLGPEELLVAAKLTFPGARTLADVAGGIDAAEARVRAAVPTAAVIYLEPDVPRSSRAT